MWLPVWYLAMQPSARSAIITYGHQFSAKWGRKIRNVLRDVGDRFGVHLSPEKESANELETAEGGSVLATGINGVLTGHGFDLMVFDDPYKNRQQAESEVVRESVLEFYRSTARSRLEPGGSMVCIMQRWREDDLVGFLLSEESGETWTIINLPAVAEDDDPLGREVGDPLWPERYDNAALDAIRTSTASYNWASQYQQRPSPAGGAIFQRQHFRYWHEDRGFFVLETDVGPKRIPSYGIRVVQVADTAMKEKTTDDYTAVVTLGVTAKKEILVLDVFRARLEVPDQLPALLRLREKWKPLWQGVEDRGSGVGLIQAAARLGKPMRPLNPTTDKVDRAVPASVWYENHRVYHRAGADWLDVFEHEMLYFPTGSHDDMVDALAYGIREMSGTMGLDRSKLVDAARRETAPPDPRQVLPRDDTPKEKARRARKAGIYEQGGPVGGIFR